MQNEDVARIWIDPRLDGDGGGLGKYKGLKVQELQALFSEMATEGSARNLSGILRITYEQLEARSQLAVSAYAALSLAILTLVLLVAAAMAPPSMHLSLLRGAGMSAVLTVGFGFGAVRSWHQTRASFAQHRAIVQLAAHFLNSIACDPNFQPKKLDSLQVQTLKRVLKESKLKSTQLENLLSL